MNETIMVIAAHPDDEVLGCGGTIARLIGLGHQVHIVIVAEGLTSRIDSTDNSSSELTQLHDSSRQSALVLGTSNISHLGLPDNKLDTLPLLDIVQKVEECISKVKPSIIYTHSACDLNIDHSIVHKAVLTACRPMPGCFVKKILAFEILSSTEWRFNQNSPFIPNVYTDISGFIDIKLNALSCYQSELRSWPHPRSLEAVRFKAAVRGSEVGLAHAEAFMLIRDIQ